MPPTKNEKSKCNARAQKNRNLKKGRSDPDLGDDISDTEWVSESDSDSSSDTCSNDTDSTYTPPKKSNFKSKFGSKKSKIIVEEEDEDNDDVDDDDEDEDADDDADDDDDDDENSRVDPRELRKTIAALFPSNYINQKVKADEKTNKSKKSSSKKSKKRLEEEEEEDDEDYDEDEVNERAKEFSIFFLGEGQDDEDEAAIDPDADANEECNSDDEKMFMKETYEPILLPKSIMEEPAKSQDKNKKTKSSHKNKKPKEEEVVEDVENEYFELVELKKHLLDKLALKPKSKILLHAIEECRESIQKLVKKSRMKNAKKYYKLVNLEETQTSEIDYFKKKLSHKEQLRAMKELKEINDHIHIEKPYRLTLLDSNIPAKYKATVMQKLNMLRSMEAGDPEYYKLKTWVDTFMRVPFSVNKNLSVSITDGIDKCSEFMENAMKTLDTCVYGLQDAKMQIMQMLGQWITNPDAMGSAIAIKGPPGTGKTSLVKEGISKILGREFTFIALGGTGDASFLEGHSYTYEGSMWGKIVQILIDSKCMNPVIYFDELDKVSDTPRGEEIIGILTHLTDTTQNNQFHDKYFSEIDFDLSKCLFIFSYNDESKVNPILRDRMYRIQTKGYDAKEKGIIARNYLLPKIREQVNFSEDDVIIPDDTLQSIITNKGMTKEEDGVRNLKRCLEIIHTKLNLFRLMKPGQNLFVKEMDVEVTFPFTVSKKNAELLIKSEESQNQSLLAMYV